MLPTVEELPVEEGENDLIPRHMVECLEYLEHQAGKPLRPLLAHLAPHRMGQKLRQEFHEAQHLQMLDLCPWLKAPGLPVQTGTGADIPYNQKRPNAERDHVERGFAAKPSEK